MIWQNSQNRTYGPAMYGQRAKLRMSLKTVVELKQHASYDIRKVITFLFVQALYILCAWELAELSQLH